MLFRSKATGSLTLQLGPQWQFAMTPLVQRQVDTQQYITVLGGGRPETFGNRYIFGAIDRHTYSLQFRTGFTLKPDLNIDVYAEPFAASGRYWNIGELLMPGSRLRVTYGSGSTTAGVQPDGSLRVTDGSSSFTVDRKSTRLNSSHVSESRMPSSA